jgi:hypothetical protein
MDDIMHALYVRAKFAKGEQEIRDGKGIPTTKRSVDSANGSSNLVSLRAGRHRASRAIHRS